MAINFPASPTLNQTYTYNGRTWTWNGVGWQATGASGLSVYTKTDFTATASQTTFTVAYTVGFVDVYYNGSKLSITEYTATNGTSVVLGTACASGDIVETVAWTVSTTLNPALGVATATSLAIGGATIGSNALAVTGTTLLNSALTYGGVTLSNAVTGTGNMVLSASPTLTGTLTAAGANFSGTVTSTAGNGFRAVPATATNAALFQGTNTGGSFYVGLDDSGGVSFGKGAYTAVLWNSANTPTVLTANGTEFLRGLAAGGTQFTGTITAAAANFSGAVGVGANNFGSTALSIAYPSASVNGLGVSNTSAGGEVWWIGDGVGSSAGRFCFYSNTHSAIPLYFTYNQVTVNTALNYGGVTLSNSVTGTGSMVLSSGPRFSSPVGIGAAGVTVATYDTLQIGTTSGSSIGTGGLINFVGGAAGTRGYIFCDASLSGLIIQRGTNTDPIRFVDQNTADMGRFGTDGSFLIGTTTNGGWHGSDKLESYVGGTGSAALSGYNSGTTGGALRLRVNATGVDFADFYYSTSVVGYISTNGTATAYNTTSDARLKDNITDAPDAGAIIDALRVRSWDWKSTGAHEEFGFVAQEEFTVYAPAVSEGDADPDAITKQWGRDDSKLVPLLVKEIQSLRARVKNLEGTH